jgi:hypothetical protein
LSRTPHSFHQLVCANIAVLLGDWNDRDQLGRVLIGPGIVFSDDDDHCL